MIEVFVAASRTRHLLAISIELSYFQDDEKFVSHSDLTFLKVFHYSFAIATVQERKNRRNLKENDHRGGVGKVEISV